MRKLTAAMVLVLVTSCSSSEPQARQQSKPKGVSKEMSYNVIVQSCGILSLGAYLNRIYNKYINKEAKRDIKFFLYDSGSLNEKNVNPRMRELSVKIADKDPDWMSHCMVTMTRSFFRYVKTFKGDPSFAGGAFITEEVEMKKNGYISLIGKRKKKTTKKKQINL